MYKKNYLDILDKTYKKGYNESIFDDDEFAKAAMDYLYSRNNRRGITI